MPIQKIVKSFPSTTSKDQVPKLFHEPHVETGFRHLHQPWSYYFFSVFQVHNECMNTWTHLIALWLILYRTYRLALEFDFINDPYMWPLLASLLTMIILYICSSCAHCFSNKSESIHYTCFMIDYAGIGLYGMGSTMLHYAYCLHTDMVDTWAHHWDVELGVCLGVLVTVCCSISKTRYSRPYPFVRRIWQLSSTLAVYVWLIYPIAYRVALYLFHHQWDSGLSHHIQQMIWFFAGGFFFGSDVPQRFCPGKFDFIGHSHQIFHICILMTSYKQLDAVYEDIKNNWAEIHRLPEPTLINSFGAVLLTIVLNMIAVMYFRSVACRKIHDNNQQNNNINHNKTD
ncbi:hypothetical protein LOTGIDRAFT_137083 [Lottia gigantea]|uniref:Uncharacterized protein n=1 Tax=Lottia gigantea TaxID=225164 RepID=V4BC04_LOTGI|nr:hypothetical protein LOTGIDRAFT_137083 [Lottia gigantea]ESP03617.1 hypothetical protein LOTGIDRAFT_137083 [Lottia gigantea]